MKMFNTVKATFAGVIEDVLIDPCGGQTIKKGQVLYKVRPDSLQIVTSGGEEGFACEPWLQNVSWVIDDVWRKKS
jgi:hypothetical protein